MKHLKRILLAFTFISTVTTTNAQLLKRLGQRLEKTIEKTIERKAEEKVERTTENAFDSTFNSTSKKNTNKTASILGSIGNQPKPEENYTFSHKYVMEITSENNSNTLNYYLSNSGHFMGMDLSEKKSDVFTVMDAKRNALYTFMTSGKDKTLISTGFDITATTEEQNSKADVSIKKTGQTKTILGYSCDEFEVSATDFSGTIWVTQDAGVQFLKMKPMKKSAFNQTWLNYAKGLVMEMTMVDKSKRKAKHITMRCIALNKTNFTIHSQNYKSLF